LRNKNCSLYKVHGNFIKIVLKYTNVKSSLIKRMVYLNFVITNFSQKKQKHHHCTNNNNNKQQKHSFGMTWAN